MLAFFSRYLDIKMQSYKWVTTAWSPTTTVQFRMASSRWALFSRARFQTVDSNSRGIARKSCDPCPKREGASVAMLEGRNLYGHYRAHVKTRRGALKRFPARSTRATVLAGFVQAFRSLQLPSRRSRTRRKAAFDKMKPSGR